jgi:hypothetical protein
MTRARALKQIIRDRAAKTGERYTTARRQVLKALDRPSIAIVPKPKPAPPVTVVSTKGGMSDAKAREKTGHGIDHWFEVLDRFGAVEKGHTAAANHLYEAHKVDGWYAQGITVAYERARGVRAMNQRCDGAFEVSVSKVMTAKTAAVITAITDARQRRRWTGDVDPALVKALAAGVADKKSKGFVVRPDGQARFRFKWGDSTVQFNLYPKPGSKVSFVVQHMNLDGAGAVEEKRRQWKTAFGAIAALLGASK